MRKHLLLVLTLVALVGWKFAASKQAVADSSSSAPAVAPPEAQLPPGWTMEDMQKLMAAGTLGPMHEHLREGIGTWNAKCTMWMTPGAEPIVSEGTSTVTPILDGRYIQVEMNGEMPGMGPYKGIGTYGYDNVAKKFVATWIDSFSTGIMIGEGKLSDDGKTLTWDYVGNCPLSGGPIKIQDVETVTGPNTKTIVSSGPDRKTGEVFKMMQIEMTRQQ